MAAYKPLIKPSLEYACAVRDRYTETDNAKLEQVQRLPARFMFNGYRRRESVTNMLAPLGLERLRECRKNITRKLDFLFYHKHLRLNPLPYITPIARCSTRSDHGNKYVGFLRILRSFLFSHEPL